MDPFKLLSRSSKLSRNAHNKQRIVTPSSGQTETPQLFSANDEHSRRHGSRKRKRGQNGNGLRSHEEPNAIEFFQRRNVMDDNTPKRASPSAATTEAAHDRSMVEERKEEVPVDRATLTLEERKRILKEHKLKITWLNPDNSSKNERRKAKRRSKDAPKGKPLLFPSPLQSFRHLSSRFGISDKLIANVIDQSFTVPTEVQVAALPLLLEDPASHLSGSKERDERDFGVHIDLFTVAPTGSGKTLAYILPLLHSIQRRKPIQPNNYRHASVIILVPTKELAGQIVNEGRKLAHGTGISISQMRKGMILASAAENVDRGTAATHDTILKADIVVSTPGLLQGTLDGHANAEALSRVDHLVLDEADVLLDPLFREQTLNIWRSCTNSRLRISLWSATMGSNIEELAMSTIDERRHQLATENDVKVEETPMIRLVVGLKDSAVPNVQHKLIYAATEQGKLMGLRQLLHPAASSVDFGPPLRPPFLVFTQTIERAVALHAELLYDIPAEAGGINRIAVLHSDLSDTARDTTMTRFRKGEIWILITTDLLSRGVDFRGVNGVVNYDIPNSSAAYVHRVGRTGRAGREGGVAVTLYSKEDIPYLKHVANVVALAQKSKGDENGMQQWLLEAIPKQSKNDKQNLKKRGIESRTSRGRLSDPKATRKARISSKAGFVRRAENKRKGAILGSRRRAELEQDEAEGDETDFGGFD